MLSELLRAASSSHATATAQLLCRPCHVHQGLPLVVDCCCRRRRFRCRRFRRCRFRRRTHGPIPSGGGSTAGRPWEGSRGGRRRDSCPGSGAGSWGCARRGGWGSRRRVGARCGALPDGSGPRGIRRAGNCRRWRPGLRGDDGGQPPLVWPKAYLPGGLGTARHPSGASRGRRCDRRRASGGWRRVKPATRASPRAPARTRWAPAESGSSHQRGQPSDARRRDE